jgi:hypothetical protein
MYVIQPPWLTLYYLDYWEAEIRRSWFQVSFQDPMSTNKPSMMVHICDLSYMEAISRRITM